MRAGGGAQGIYFESKNQLPQRLAKPHPTRKAGGQAKSRASPHTLRVGPASCPPRDPPRGWYTRGPLLAQVRNYFVTSLRGGQRRADEPRGGRAASTSAAAGHLRWA